MDTICVQLNNVTMQDATSVLNKETIHISNHPDCGQGWLMLNTCRPITIQFYSEKGPYPEHYNTADPKNTPNYVDSNYSFNLESGSHFLFWNSEFSCSMSITDITAITLFDTTITRNSHNQNSKWKGGYIPVEDLTKLSMAESLYLRFSLKVNQENTIIDLRNFHNLKHLFLGQAKIGEYYANGSIKQIIISDQVMGQLRALHIECEYAPNNMDKLQNLWELYLMHSPCSWSMCSDKAKVMQGISTIVIYSDNANDYKKILTFVNNALPANSQAKTVQFVFGDKDRTDTISNLLKDPDCTTLANSIAQKCTTLTFNDVKYPQTSREERTNLSLIIKTTT